MNILPKKRWHVRTKENVARVRRDQKKAAEEEERIKERALLAEREYRMNILRRNAGQRVMESFDYAESKTSESQSLGEGGSGVIDEKSGHINFFADLEREELANTEKGNKEYAAEKRKEKDEFESKLGILKYLGEGSKEFMKEVPWYEKNPQRALSTGDSLSQANNDKRFKEEERTSSVSEEKKKSRSHRKERHKGKEKRHHKLKRKKKHRSSHSESSESEEDKVEKFAKLRAERLKREECERQRAKQLLN
ncbi:hypothetical protein AB6A40_011439 [Gnathostoma spinigerum]|uniref:CBF1-interacting co-repressor CIR N-terminal domain-containing protein n=1 Tax=Gnathostoma spinigerum TaxID=75299 RepID=A0ABD6EZ34_9BILA